MTDRTSEDELREIPLWRANKETWPLGVREIRVEEAECLGIDRHGNLYWDGKPVEVRHVWLSLLLTRWQQIGAVIIVVSALICAIGAVTQAWVAYEDLASPATEGFSSSRK